MSRLTILPALAVAIAVTLSGAPAEAKKHNDNKNANVGAAIIGGLVAGAVIGAAVSDTKTHPKQIYVAPPPPPRAQPFSPKSGITCYPAQQACYRYDGAYNSNWTWKIYAH